MNSLKIIFRFFFREKKLLPITSVTVVVLSSFVVIFPLYTLFLIEKVIPSKDIELMNVSLCVMLALIFVRFFLHIMQDVSVLVLREKIEKGIMREYIQNVFLLKWSELASLDQGILAGRLNVFISDIYWFLNEFIYFVFYALYLLLFLLIWMFFINRWLFLSMILFLPLHFLNIFYFSPKIKNASTQFVAHYNLYNSFIHQVLGGLIEIRTNFMNSFFARMNSQHNDLLLKPLFWKKNYASIQNAIQVFLISCNTALVLGIGIWETGRGNLQKGDLVFFLLLMSFFYEPVYRLLRINEMMQATARKIEDLYEIIHKKNRESIPIKPSALPDKPKILKLDKITYQLEERYLLWEASFTFHKGNIYLLSGPSGEGKSTLLHIIAGLIEEYQGVISIDHVSQRESDPYHWRSKVGYAFQNSYLFHDTILGNIIVKETPDACRLEAAKYHAVLDHWAEGMEVPMDYWIEEKGKNLSGGQQQRIQLARIFYQNAPIILMDEPTASLDATAEQLFFTRLQNLKKNKIILIISHNDKNYEYADENIILTGGKLYKSNP